jgi:hypothetical protein
VEPLGDVGDLLDVVVYPQNEVGAVDDPGHDEDDLLLLMLMQWHNKGKPLRTEKVKNTFKDINKSTYNVPISDKLAMHMHVGVV